MTLPSYVVATINRQFVLLCKELVHTQLRAPTKLTKKKLSHPFLWLYVYAVTWQPRPVVYMSCCRFLFCLPNVQSSFDKDKKNVISSQWQSVTRSWSICLHEDQPFLRFTVQLLPIIGPVRSLIEYYVYSSSEFSCTRQKQVSYFVVIQLGIYVLFDGICKMISVVVSALQSNHYTVIHVHCRQMVISLQ